MLDKRFYDYIRPMFRGGKLSQSQVDGINLILETTMDHRLDRQRTASVFGTAFWETNQEMQPVEENLNYSLEAVGRVFGHRIPESERHKYARNPEALANRVYANRIGNGPESSGDGWKFRGRGFPQTTGRGNYRIMGKILGVDFESDPDLMLDPNLSVQVMVKGMIGGHFTGRSLDDVSEGPGVPVNFVNDRAVINGKDRAIEIARISRIFYDALEHVDLLAKSRTIQAAKKTKRSADAGIVVTTITAAKPVSDTIKEITDVLANNPDGLIEIAQKGMTLANILKVGGTMVAVVFIVLFVYQRIQAGKVEKARREDNAVKGT